MKLIASIVLFFLFIYTVACLLNVLVILLLACLGFGFDNWRVGFIRQCKTGKHTTEKQVFAQPKKSTVSAPAPAPAPAWTTNVSPRDSCSRCRQGFYCSDHGSQSKPLNPAVNASSESKASAVPKQPKKMVDINTIQKCKNQGCGKEFKEKDNHDAACSYHPGPAIFHDRLRGWKCCDIHVKEFDEFMSIPPCTKGWHNADP